MTPCWHSTLGNFLFPECEQGPGASWSSCSIELLVILLSITYWLVLDIAGDFLIFAVNVFFLPSYAFKYYLRYFKVAIITITEYIFLATAKTGNSVNAKDFGLIQSKLKIYRELQLLCKLYNIIQKDIVIAVILWCATSGLIICLYCFISLGSGITLPQLMMLGLILLDAVLGIFIVFGTFGKVNQKSRDVLVTVKEKVIPSFPRKGERKWLHKFWVSLPPLKVSVGDVNYVDNTTPLVLLEFSLGMLVSLLLV